MEKRIENLKWKPMWTSHLGCVKGCLEYLGSDVSDAWLFGGTGHAFIINVHEVICPSGPTAWRTEMLFKLGRNLGYVIDGVWGFKSDGDFAEKQERAWENTKRAIDQDLPCYGWELDIPEYYVVHGYDDEGYHFSGPRCDSGKGPKPWKELGDSQIGVLEMYCVNAGEPADDEKTVREALEFAVEHSKSPAKWIFPKYKAGLAAYDNWMAALESGKAHALGAAYNAAVWSECRSFAVQFLKEAKERLATEVSPVVDKAIGHYTVVEENLKEVSKLFPFPPEGEEVKDTGRCKEALKHLRNARDAEECGLGALREILSQF
jgi:hypothetical protein